MEHEGSVDTLAFSPDNKTMVTASLHSNPNLRTETGHDFGTFRLSWMMISRGSRPGSKPSLG